MIPRRLQDTSPPPGPRIAVRTLALGLACLILTACGYSNQGLYPSAYRSVAVPIWENRTFHRGMEDDLTEALIKQLEQRTPYKRVASGAADTSLTGSIINVDQKQLSRTSTGSIPQELELIVTVDFEWRDLRTGEVIKARRGFTAAGRYRPARPVGEPIDYARREAVNELAEQIVSTLRDDW